MKKVGILSGQTTIFLSLVLSICSGLIISVLYSAIHAGKRAMAENTADVSVHSMFGEFNSKLLEEYDLFYLDMQELGRGIGKEGLALECEVMAAHHLNYDDRLSEVLGYTDLLKPECPDIQCKRYSIASDCQGEVYRQQAVNYMKACYPTTIINLLKELTKDVDHGSSTESQEVSESVSMRNSHIGAVEAQEENEKMKNDLGGIDPDLLGYMNLIRSGGILNYVWGKPLSCNFVEQKDLLRQRPGKVEGDGFYKKMNYNGIEEKLLFHEYLMDHFGHALDIKTDRSLQYEIEYIISGKASDSENLKWVAYRLLALRETANCLHIISDSSKQSQAQSLAITLSSALLMPEAVQMFHHMIIGVWAFGESMLDLKELFDGKKVPVIKDASNFKLDLKNITNIFGQKYESCQSPLALDYKGYLRLLLLLGKREDITLNSMELIEANMRKEERYRDFRMDVCVEWAEFEMIFYINKEIICTKSFGYIQ